MKYIAFAAQVATIILLSVFGLLIYLEINEANRKIELANRITRAKNEQSKAFLRYKGAVAERDKDDIEAFYIHVKDSLSPNRLHLSRVKGLKLVNFTTAPFVALERGDEWEPDPYTLFVRIGAAFPQDSVLMEVIDIINQSKKEHGK